MWTYCADMLQIFAVTFAVIIIFKSFFFIHWLLTLQAAHVFVYDGIGGICLCINLIHSAACVALHEGREILCPDVSDRVQRCSTFRETMAVHTLQCAHRHLEWNNELPQTGMFLLHPYSSSFGLHAPSTHSFNWVLNVLKNTTGGTWLVKARFLLAIHINFKINTICKYSFNDSIPVHCQQHVHWSLDGCMPFPDGVHRSIGSTYPNYLTTLKHHHCKPTNSPCKTQVSREFASHKYCRRTILHCNHQYMPLAKRKPLK
jgi:hypothetical protein